MNLTNETFAPLEVMIDEFVRGGIEHAVVCPGSRNAPISYALAARDELRCWSVLDERQAGFFALGIAKSTGLPVVVTCTSGTAAANLHPAVIEADHAGVPLIVLTADRPPELRDIGAGQAIDQIKLYGGSVRWFLEAGNHPLTDETLRHFRASAARALTEASGADPGPVHLNLPLREPLRPEPAELGELASSLGARGRPEGIPWALSDQPGVSGGDVLSALAAAERPLIVAGEQHTPGLAAAVAELAESTGAPVLADSLSQMRRKSLAESATIVASYDLILREPAAIGALKPDLILRIGSLPTSKPLRAWLAGAECRQLAFDPRGRCEDPTRAVSQFLACDPLTCLTTAAREGAKSLGDPNWTQAWAAAERAAQTAIETALAKNEFGFEPAALREVLSTLEAATIFVSSSMPIRDVESYGPVGSDDLRYLANRGTNGIDGVVSSALGVRAPFDCDRVVLLTGDLALLYDASALAIAQRHELPITIVCLDNSGGGIFSFLPLAEHRQHFESMVATPHAVDIEALARAYGIDYSAPRDFEELRGAAGRPGLVHIKALEREENKRAHDRVSAHVVQSIAEALTEHGALH